MSHNSIPTLELPLSLSLSLITFDYSPAVLLEAYVTSDS